MNTSKPVLYIFSGLPATGKSTIAKILANRTHSVYLRIDTIEQGIRDLCNFNVQGEGYRLAYNIADDNLKIGNSVVSDQCNLLKITRNEWSNVAVNNHCKYIHIEIICSDKAEHKSRTEQRQTEIEGLILPTWEEILRKEFDPCEEECIIIDTANKSVEECVEELMNKILTQSNNSQIRLPE